MNTPHTLLLSATHHCVFPGRLLFLRENPHISDDHVGILHRVPAVSIAHVDLYWMYSSPKKPQSTHFPKQLRPLNPNPKPNRSLPANFEKSRTLVCNFTPTKKFLDMASVRNRQKKASMTLQIPSHVQTNLNKEARLLQRNLEDLEKETRHRMRCIAQEQQVATIKLRSLQVRLEASQKKFYSLIHHDEEQGAEIESDGRRDSQSVSIYTRLRPSSGDYYLQVAAVVKEDRREAGSEMHGKQRKIEHEGRKESMRRRGSVVERRGSVVEAGKGSRGAIERRGSLIVESSNEEEQKTSWTGTNMRGSRRGSKKFLRSSLKTVDQEVETTKKRVVSNASKTVSFNP